jgi:hypothetical protein
LDTPACELRAVDNVPVLASQRVLERSFGDVCLLDSLFELGELVAGKLPPGIGGRPFDARSTVAWASENPTSRRNTIIPTRSTAEAP